ncbi:MAG: DUF480 domain-containing protein [Actinomycetota bacterium]
MELGSVDARVLGCLIEKETTVPDSYPLTLNALRSACNQSTNRDPVTDYDTRTIEGALASLKSSGLVRFVHPSHGGRNIRYRQVADELWGLGVGELGVLAVLLLRGPETAAILRARADKHLAVGGVSVDEALDTLMSTSPEPFVERAERAPGEREVRFRQLLVTDTADESAVSADGTNGSDAPGDERGHGDERRATRTGAGAGDGETRVGVHDADRPQSGGDDELTALVELLAAEVAELRARVERLEAGDPPT